VDLNHAEHHALPHVCVGVPHLVGQDVREALEIVDELLALDGRQERRIWLGFLHFLDVPQLVLDHPEQRLELRGLLGPQQGLNGLREEVGVAGDHQLLEQVLSHLIGDALMLGGNIWRISPQSCLENIVPKSLEVLLAELLILILSIVNLHHISQDFEAAVSNIGLRILILHHHVKHTLDKRVKVVGDKLCTNLLVHLILLFISFKIVTSDLFGDDYPLDILEALLWVLAALKHLALHHENLLGLLQVWGVRHLV
jgi:hypothetical protein